MSDPYIPPCDCGAGRSDHPAEKHSPTCASLRRPLSAGEFYQSLFCPCPICTPYRKAVQTLSQAHGMNDPEMLTLMTYDKDGKTPVRALLHPCTLDCRMCENRGKVLNSNGRQIVEELREISRQGRPQHATVPEEI